jgi:hypothetical protein
MKKRYYLKRQPTLEETRHLNSMMIHFSLVFIFHDTHTEYGMIARMTAKQQLELQFASPGMYFDEISKDEYDRYTKTAL